MQLKIGTIQDLRYVDCKWKCGETCTDTANQNNMKIW